MMVYTGSPYHPALLELARAGNFRAIAHWLNQFLSPYGVRAFVGIAKPGCLKILIELQPSPDGNKLAGAWRTPLVRYVCYLIWQLNSALIEGAKVAARFAGQRQILWEQSVRINSPARRSRAQQSSQLRARIRHTAQQKSQLKLMRTLLMSGSTVFAFIFGGVLAYTKAPVDHSNAFTSNGSGAARPNQVQAASEVVPVVKQDRVASPNDPTVTMMFSGDVTLADSYQESHGDDPSWGFAQIDEYRQADLAMVNLENPLTTATTPMPNKQFNFKADPKLVRVLKEGGVDLVNLANNHTMDYEEPGLAETIQSLDGEGILHVGAGKNITEARRPRIVDVKGQRIAFLGYYGELHAAEDNKAGTNPIDEARIAQDIRSIRGQVDWIVVNYHWGEEKATHPADWQVDLAHFTVDQGADVVVGHHPHVLQGAEIYKGRPIAYSMGNFIFGGNSRSNYDTAVMKVAVKDRQMKVEFLPVEVRQYQPKIVGGDRGAEILKQIGDLSTEFKQPMPSSVVLNAQPLPQDSTNPTPSGANHLVAPGINLQKTPAKTSPQDPSAPAKPDSFINQPTSTPFIPAQPAPNSSDEPAKESSTDDSSSHSAAPSPRSSEPTATEAAPETSSAPSKPATAPQAKARANWSTPGQVGAALMPNVSLMAAAVW